MTLSITLYCHVPYQSLPLTMDRCPAELWEIIFILSCTDNGFTGRSLSLVSRFFNNASKPYKYHSIALCGIAEILSFSNLIKILPYERLQVHHLLLTDEYPFESLEDVDPSSNHSDTRGLRSIMSKLLLKTWRKPRDNKVRVSPNLESLVKP